uniref:peptidylprolyl isomerase n=1 Tax=Haptolina brevifila TaxID=156173 RepID=A0A7S2D335_9EUKA
MGLLDRSGQARVSAAALAAMLMLSPLHAPSFLPAGIDGAVQARELASGSGSRVNKDPNSLLRLGLPAQPAGIREVQLKVEEAADSVQRLLFTNANQAVGQAKGSLKGKSAAILKAVPQGSAQRGAELLASITTGVDDLQQAISTNTVGGAQFERVLKDISALEELIASGYTQPIPPKEFGSLPWLKGRATVDFVLKRPDGKFDVDGKLYDKLEMTTIVDGYTAPLTAGNFVDLVQKGFYDGMHVQRSDGFVVQTGDPTAEGKEGAKNGYVPAGSSSVRKIPLEVYVSGDKQPMYSTTFDDDGRGGYASALPFNAYGAMGMAREEYDSDSASSQWFWLLFDSDLTPAGKNLLDGRYSCFGYTVDGARLLSDVKEGDVIVSAKVTAGAENLQNSQ